MRFDVRLVIPIVLAKKKDENMFTYYQIYIIRPNTLNEEQTHTQRTLRRVDEFLSASDTVR